VDERLMFVIGAPRSGTTLLMRMLNVHPDVLSRPEPHLLTPLAHLGYYGYVDKAPYDPFQSHQAVRQLVEDLPGGEAAYIAALRAYTDAVYGGLLEPSGRRFFLDKTPAYALVLPFVATLYPKGAYITLTRHPFAIFSSYAQSFFDDDWEAAHRHNPILERYVPAIATFLRDRPVEKLAHVRYEELVTDPPTHLRRICETIGLDYRDDLVEYGKTAVQGQGLGDPIGVGQHDRPTTESVHKWAAGVAHDERRIALLRTMVARISDEDLATWGYTRESLWEPLGTVSPEKAANAKRRANKLDRYTLERRLLVVLRRNIHHNWLGRVLRKVRFTLDVLLRE
jgi:hypothetical protein